MITLHVLPPPSTNALYVPGKGRRGPMKVRSPKYRQWLTDSYYRNQHRVLEAGWNIPKRGESLRVDVAAEIDYRRDLDNVLKALLDFLQQSSIIADDRYVDELHAARVPKSDGDPMVRVTVSIR